MADKTFFVPVNGNILVKRHEAEEKVTPGGIHIPKTSQDAPCTAEIIALGKYNKDLPEFAHDLRGGEIVVIGKYTGCDIELNDEKYTVIKYDDILGLFRTRNG